MGSEKKSELKETYNTLRGIIKMLIPNIDFIDYQYGPYVRVHVL